MVKRQFPVSPSAVLANILVAIENFELGQFPLLPWTLDEVGKSNN
jgi:hypothetical protein